MSMYQRIAPYVLAGVATVTLTGCFGSTDTIKANSSIEAQAAKQNLTYPYNVKSVEGEPGLTFVCNKPGEPTDIKIEGHDLSAETYGTARAARIKTAAATACKTLDVKVEELREKETQSLETRLNK